LSRLRLHDVRPGPRPSSEPGRPGAPSHKRRRSLAARRLALREPAPRVQGSRPRAWLRDRGQGC
jgi:hypothetical protein